MSPRTDTASTPANVKRPDPVKEVFCGTPPRSLEPLSRNASCIGLGSCSPRTHSTARPCCVLRVASPQFVEVAAYEPKRRPRRTSGARRKIHCRRERSPKSAPFDRRSPTQGTPVDNPEELSTGTHTIGFISPSALSSKVSFGTTRNEQTAPPLPCSGSARLPPAPTQATLPPDRV